MNIPLLIMEFLPLVIYIAVDAWKGFRAGIIAAMACTVLMVCYEYFMFGEIDKFIIGEGLMIVGLGYVSLKMNNDKYFKFQPTVLAMIFAGVFAWFQLFDQPLMLHFIPHMEKLLEGSPSQFRALDLVGEGNPAEIVIHDGRQVNPVESQAPDAGSETLKLLHSTYFQKILGRMSGHMIWLFLAHGLIMTYAALRLSTAGWFAWRLAIYPALFVLVVINQLFA